METRTVLTARTPRVLLVAAAAPLVAVAVVAMLVPAGRRPALLGLGAMLLALDAALAVVMRRRAVLLDDERLSTRWVPGRPRIARRTVEAVEVTGNGPWAALLVVHDGQRTLVNLNDTLDGAARTAAAIRSWSGVEGSPRVVEPAGADDERGWHVAAEPKPLWLPAVYIGLGLLVPLSLLWHPVPWWAWLAAAVNCGIGLRVLRFVPVAHDVRFAGDELVTTGRGTRRRRAADIRRVVTTSERGERSVFLDLASGEPARMPVGDQPDARAAHLQSWAEAHGGGRGCEEPFRPRRNWRGLLVTAVATGSAAACLMAIPPWDTHDLWGTALVAPLGNLVFAVGRGTVVRDWSRP